MENRAHRNPVFAHLTRNARWPTARATLWLAAGLMLASLALMTLFQMALVRLVYENEYALYQIFYDPAWLLQIASWGLHLVMPLVAAPVAATLTVRETQDESFQLLRVTPNYSPAGAVWGLVLAALYRLRLLLVLMVALSPFVINILSELDIVFVSREEYEAMYDELPVYVDSCFGYENGLASYDGHICSKAASQRGRNLLYISMLPWLVGLWGATLFSAALAVWLALWWGRMGWVWVYSIGIPLCALVVLTLLGSLMGTISTSLPMPMIDVRPWPLYGFEVAVLFAVVFYVLAWGVMRLARRWA